MIFWDNAERILSRPGRGAAPDGEGGCGVKYIDLNAWLGSWPFRGLRDNTPDTLIRRLDRAGIGTGCVSRIEAILHRSVQPANERFGGGTWRGLRID